jgi:hypothetical protein
MTDASKIKEHMEVIGADGVLGPAREFEVLMKRVVTPVKERHRGAGGVSSLSQEVGAKRDA